MQSPAVKDLIYNNNVAKD